MVGWHHQLNGHEFEQSPGDSEGQGSLVCNSPWGHKESDITYRLNNNNSFRWIAEQLSYIWASILPQTGPINALFGHFHLGFL